MALYKKGISTERLPAWGKACVSEPGMEDLEETVGWNGELQFDSRH